MGRKSPRLTIHHAINAIAREQYRVISHEQLTDFGLAPSAIRSRVARGALHRAHRGVFVVGPLPLTANGMYIAAVLACGDDARLSHRSCAALRGLRPDNRRTVDVTTPREGRHRAGITVHRSRGLTDADFDEVDGIRCTSVARTLLDLTEVVDRPGLERAIDRAEQLRVLDLKAVYDILARNPTRKGAKVLRSVLDEHYSGSTLTKPGIEELVLSICRTAGLPQPEVNVWMTIPGEEMQVDFVWAHQGLIVEADGHESHGTRQAFGRDRERDQQLTLAGWRVVRFTWRQITRAPERVARTLRDLLNGVRI